MKKSGTVDFKTWYRDAHGENTPWGDEESEAFVTRPRARSSGRSPGSS